jgi:hypothetical protein
MDILTYTLTHVVYTLVSSDYFDEDFHLRGPHCAKSSSHLANSPFS